MCQKNSQRFFAALLFAGSVAVVFADASHAASPYRQSYGSWSYNQSTSYYYTSYYYKPVVTYPTYKHHYCIHYPTRPRYVYYYNPVRKVYWGRYDVKQKGYSLLAEKDRKEKLDDIPEKAFPKPGKMPMIPESEDNVRIKPIDIKNLPKAKIPEALPS
jgi:hypothetical protein